MPKREQIELHSCHRHRFSLTPKKDNIINPQHLKASFCQHPSPQHTNQNQHIQQCPHLNYPVFNLDRNCLTPTFVGRLDRLAYQQAANVKQEQKELAASPQKSQLVLSVLCQYVPKPKSKHSYCSVCRSKYDDYLTHINGQSHLRKIRKSDFNRHILQLTRKYKNKAKARDEKRKRRTLKPIPMTAEIESDSVRIIENAVGKLVRRDVGYPYCTMMSNYNHPSQYGWYEQLSRDYARQFVEIFRGMNQEQQLSACSFNLQTAVHQQICQNINPYPYLYPPAVGWHPPQEAPKKKNFVYIIIDE